ncbi:MAG TPA: tetratricopeptide repeat protein [Mariniphaga anaerophila]|uniref:Tetratricopeptide repeat protein n=1 Tax=Mariniphaga anaerophila TaxID=1484053 RepID=A0A831LJA3_9BACT|nr:tetratricopeptide repeat protein [Mariniphaga anaerophila]
MAKKKSQQADNLQELESALTKTEQFIEENQKPITYAVGLIILLVIAYLGITRFYMQPREKEAQSQMFMAENYFEQDSFNLAINGDGNYLGFLDIIDDYKMTKSANLAKYYTGISYLHLGQYEDALDYLNGFKTKDMLLGPIAEGAKGDAKLEMGDNQGALRHYRKAFSMNENELTTPVYMMKAARLLESMDQLEDALAIYRQIKEKFPESNEGQNVDRYIARVEIKLG